MAKRASVGKRLEALERKAADVRVRAVETGELRLVDRYGQVRAILGMTRTGPRLAMMHEDGTVAIEVALAPDGPSVRLADEAGETRVFVGATRGAARIGLADGEGNQRLFIGVDRGGTPTVTMYDEGQRQVWTSGKSKPKAKRARTITKSRAIRTTK